MCKLSHQLKMCTCDVSDVATLEHYWVLHRFNPEKHNRVIGRTAIPDTLDVRVDAYNRSLLLQRLHEADAFDVDLNLQAGDRLQLTFRCSEPDASGQPKRKVITYGYRWAAGRWTEEPFDSLSWRWRHDPAMSGELDSTLDTDDIASGRP